MAVPYEEFIAFLLNNEGDQSLALERELIKRRAKGQYGYHLTPQGVHILLERIAAFFKNYSKLSREQIILMVKVLHYGQSLGNSYFVKEFSSRMDPGLINNFSKLIAVEIMNAVDEKESLYEQEYETNWRKEKYTECINLISGYETYCLYQPSTLLFETDRILPENLAFLLDALVLCHPVCFAQLCRMKQSVVWPLRVIERFGLYPPVDESFACDINDLMPHLTNGQQGVLLAHIWHTIALKSEDNLNYVLNNNLGFLELKTVLQILARITSDFVPQAFPDIYNIHNGRSNYEEKRRFLDKSISWLAAWLNQIKAPVNIVIENFIDYLIGRVNKEEKWVGFLLARMLRTNDSEYSKELAGAIEDRILKDYPNFWNKNGQDEEQLYFSGSLSVELIKEMTAVLISKPVKETLTMLSSPKTIAAPAKLWSYRNLHQYDKYLSEQCKTAAHALLTVRVINELHNRKEILSPDYLTGFLCFLTQLAREIPDILVSKHDQIIWEELFLNLGQLINNLDINIANKFLNDFLPEINDLRLVSKLIAGVEQGETYFRILKHLEKLVKVQKHLLRNDKLLETGWYLYSIGFYQLAISLMSEINTGKLDHQLFLYWKMLNSQCLIELAFKSEQINEQVECLKKALEVLNMSLQGGCYPHISEDESILKLQIMGWLMDRGALDVSTLSNAYNIISVLSLVNGGEDISVVSKERQLACALTLVRILGAGFNSGEIREAEMQFLCENIQPFPGQEGLQALIKAWYTDRKGEQPQKDGREKLLVYIDELNMFRQWLPQPLVLYIDKLAGDKK